MTKTCGNCGWFKFGEPPTVYLVKGELYPGSAAGSRPVNPLITRGECQWVASCPLPYWLHGSRDLYPFCPDKGDDCDAWKPREKKK